ncbi:MAG: hypothetical protein VCA34_16815 [Roseibacillus sp.]
MPVLRIHALRPQGLDSPALLQSCSEAVAAAFDCPVEHCWSLFVELRDGDYLEGGTIRSANTGTHSPIAVLSAYHGQAGRNRVAEALHGVAGAITGSFGYDAGDIFVDYREPKAGQVFTGGEDR